MCVWGGGVTSERHAIKLCVSEGAARGLMVPLQSLTQHDWRLSTISASV